MSYEQYRKDFDTFNQWAAETATSVLKSLLLINGGAAVAALSFVAAVEKKSAHSDAGVSAIAAGLTCFAAGVAVAVMAMMLAYVTHYSTMVALSAEYEKKLARISVFVKRFVHLVAGIAAFGSLYLFFKGVLQMREAVVLTLMSSV